jgi:nucleotide-binding universal stress UspA family protein
MTRIVVGVDGSAGSANALQWAVREAELRGATVVAVLAWGYLDQKHGGDEVAFDPAYGQGEAEAALAAALEATLSPAQVSAVEHIVVTDLAHRAVLDAATGADLVVVGARGLGGFAGLLLGSVSQKVLTEATCPVAVVRDGGVPDGPVAVGVDGSQPSASALSWALDEARAREVDLRAVHAWTPPFVGGYPFGAAAFDPAIIEAGARQLLEASVAERDTTGVAVHPILACTSGASALIDEGAGASLVVVGSRGRSGIARLLLGSVSHQVVQHAPGPVVVVPAG